MTAHNRLAAAIQERLLPVATARALHLGISEQHGFGIARRTLYDRLAGMPRWWLFLLACLAFGIRK